MALLLRLLIVRDILDAYTICSSFIPNSFFSKASRGGFEDFNFKRLCELQFAAKLHPSFARTASWGRSSVRVY